MYISKIGIKNFRGFKNDVFIDFNEGVNVFIGANNCGKSNLIKALSLLFGTQPKTLTADDFNKDITIQKLKESSPKIQISAFIKESEQENLYSDDLVSVSTCLTKLDKPYEARLTYEFYLPEKEHKEYKDEMSSISSKDIEDYWKIIRNHFIQKYTYKVYVGNPEHKTVADADVMNKFDFQFLDAIRDVERDMFTGKNTLLKEVLDFFMDYDIKTDNTKTNAERTAVIKEKQKTFTQKAAELIKILQDRMKAGKSQMLKYAEKTGASFGNANPNFEGDILDSELYSALKLIVEHETGIKLPATHNGLGYNNLIYISLLLAKMQKDASGEYLGGNAKVFPVLAIEEPEAHLHPAMQYKFLRFLKENRQKEVRQIFITTHSPNITAAVGLDEIIVLNIDNKGTFNIGYPGRVFGDSLEDKDSKAYVSRFLDVTKSDMLFAKGIIFVEGITEQLLISILAEKAGKDLEDNHIAVINVGGRYFEHFLKMFDSKGKYAIHKKIACVTDLDPQRKDKVTGKYSRCYPFELDVDREQYEYQSYSNQVVDKYNASNNHPNIQSFSQTEGIGKTFEYELILCNPCNEVLITDSMPNAEEIKNLMKACRDKKPISDMLGMLRSESKENERIKKAIEENIQWDDEKKRKHIIAARYLNSIGKGANAIELLQKIEKDDCDILVPKYIKEAVEWICQ
jgi:putative ATP-dependent endonuclease of the OLD family